MKIEIKTKDNQKLKNKIKKIIKDSGNELRVGFLQNSKYPDEDITTVQVAINNEYGHILENGKRVPPRPFIKQTVEKNNKKWMEIFEKKMKDNNLDIIKTLNLMGLVAVGDMKDTIINGSFAPLSKETIERKGTSKPLIDTTHMINSVEYDIVKKS